MGKSGGFAYLAVYALLAIFVGFIVMASELAMGRKTGQGAMGTYHALTKKFRWIGWLALFSPFAVMGFYAVLGGYCIEYMALNLSNFAFGSESLATGGSCLPPCCPILPERCCLPPCFWLCAILSTGRHFRRH